ncbi:unnamed protein product [Phytophthora fragariaefolia]|uniref:Unnamed protein product n=1 Tax=Phytophthora fragariaefolia TaxID=1490495 RepID=A0A9W6Y116_9STRA|nr:unnamed protein product [Phytophthora fragariaefolia]
MTMDNTHVRLVKNLVTSYDIFSFICEKYEGAAFHGDRYFIQHYLMEINLQKDLRSGQVKAGTVLPANVTIKGNTKRDHSKNKGKIKRNSNGVGGNYNDNRGKSWQRRNHQDSSDDGDYRRGKSHERKRRQPPWMTMVTQTATVARRFVKNAASHASLHHVTHESQWFSNISASGGSITVGGKNQIPIEGIGRVDLEVIGSKGNMKKLTLHGVLYAPQMHFSLLSVPAAVKHAFCFSFDRKRCTMQTDERFSIKAPMANNTDLYQFQAKPAVNASAFIAMSGKQRSFLLLHKRLGHPSVRILRDLSRSQAIRGLDGTASVNPKESFFSLLLDGKLPKQLWAECVCHATTLINMTPSSKTNARTPYELWYNRIPSMQYMKAFGCSAYAHITEQYRDRLDARARLCMYLGVPDHKKGYRLMDLNSHAIVYSRDVIFKEEAYPSLANLTKTPEQPVIESDQHIHTESIEPVPATTSPAGKRRLPPLREALDRTQIYYSFRTEASSETPSLPTPKRPRVTTDDTEVTLNSQEDLQEEEQRRKPLYTLLAIRYVTEPTTYRAAMKSSHANRWCKAAKAEYKSHMDNRTWVLVPPPKGRKILTCRWVFVVKYTGTGAIDRFKARLVIKGLLQEHGIDHHEMFSPVIRMEVLIIFLTIAALLDFEAHQMDVKTAQRFARGGDIHGSAGRLKSPQQGAPSVQTPKEPVRVETSSPCLVNELKSALKKRFSMTDLGEVNYLLGWSILRDRKNRTIFIHQYKYATKVLDRFSDYIPCPIATPAERNVKLSVSGQPSSESEKDVKKDIPYREAVGSIMYLMVGTRPDMAFYMREVSQFLANPGMEHWKAVVRGLKYLLGTKDCGLLLGGSLDVTPENLADKLTAYSDSDYANCPDTRRSVGGYVTMLASSPISWLSRKHHTVVLSTTEADCIKICYNPELHGRSKHIHVRYCFVQEKVERHEISVAYCNTKTMVADIFTKALDKHQFRELRARLRMKSLDAKLAIPDSVRE